MKRGGLLQRMRSAGLVLALFALTFKALLPPGFMLDTASDRIAITLCGGGDAYFDPRTGDISHDRGSTPAGENTAQHCPFALAALAPLTPPALLSTAPNSAVSFTAFAPQHPRIIVTRAAGPPLPARGPPLNA